MSVINQMLIDLDRRGASSEERQYIPEHVRALQGDTVSRFSPRVAFVLMGIAAAVLLLAGAWWGFAGRVPMAPVDSAAVVAHATPKPIRKVVPGDDAAAERIARRMSFDLFRVPETITVRPPVATASVIAPRESPKPAVMRRAEASAGKARVREEKTAQASPPRIAARAEIEKSVRELTLRQRADAEYAKGAIALHQGQPADARAAFEETLRIDPTYHAARQALVGVLLDARHQADALRVLQEGLQIAPAQIGFAMALARLQMEDGELDAGVQTLAHSIDYAASSPDYIAFYAGLLQRQQKHAEAVEQFRRALAQRGNAGVWLLGLGISLDALDRSNEAQQAYRRAKTAGDLSPELQAFADQLLR